jgi:hypothetical protein
VVVLGSDEVFSSVDEPVMLAKKPFTAELPHPLKCLGKVEPPLTRNGEVFAAVEVTRQPACPLADLRNLATSGDSWSSVRRVRLKIKLATPPQVMLAVAECAEGV